MATPRKGTPDVAREMNRAAVLRVVEQRGQVTRSEIADELGLSAAGVSTVTRQLLEDGLLAEVGKTDPGAGRPADLLGLPAGTASAVGVKVSADRLVGVVVDLSGEVLDDFRGPFDATADDPMAALADVLADQLADAGDGLLGMGLGVPGVVDVGSGRVTAPTLGWSSLEAGRTLSDRLGLPVLVDNDVNTLAVAERLYGHGRDISDFVTITLGQGIGLGIVVNGTIHRGVHGGAGEFGHTCVQPNGPMCSCGRHGCLEAIASEPAMVRDAKALGVLRNGEGIERLRAAASEGDEDAVGLFDAAGTHLGRAVGNLVNVLAPELILVAGEGVASWPLLDRTFRTVMDGCVLDVHRNVDLRIVDWGDRDWARGAAALPLRSVFVPSLFTDEPEALVRHRMRMVAGGGRDGR